MMCAMALWIQEWQPAVDMLSLSMMGGGIVIGVVRSSWCERSVRVGSGALKLPRFCGERVSGMGLPCGNQHTSLPR